MQSPHYLHSTGLTPLHTAILALNVVMHPSDLCPRVLSTQARDRLSCVQMLLHMGADHTSQVSWAVGSWSLGGCVGCPGAPNKHLPLPSCVSLSTLFTVLCPTCQLEIILLILAYIYQALHIQQALSFID